MLKNTLSVSSLLVATVLAACGGGSGAGAGTAGGNSGGGNSALFACAPVGGGSATISKVCVNCPQNAIADSASAIDTNLDTAATFSFYHPDDTSSQTSSMRLTAAAQSGIVFPAGSKAGLIFGLPTGQNVRFSATINTYLSGTLQDSRNVVAGNNGATNGETRYYGFDASTPTTKQFDSVELLLTETLPSLEQHTYRAFEFCADGAHK
jgi:hypothetical protein